MSELLGLALAAAAAFAATNLDDILVLTVLFGLVGNDGTLRGRHIVAGQYLGLGALVALSAIGAFGLLLVPDELVGLLGLIPLTLGLRGLLLAHRHRGSDTRPAVLPARRGALGVAAVTFANGADNISIYVPFFAAAGADGMAVIAIVFTALVAVWCLAGRLLGTHPATVTAIDRFGHVAVPIVFIGLGVLILLEAGTPDAAIELLGL